MASATFHESSWPTPSNPCGCTANRIQSIDKLFAGVKKVVVWFAIPVVKDHYSRLFPSAKLRASRQVGLDVLCIYHTHGRFKMNAIFEMGFCMIHHFSFSPNEKAFFSQSCLCSFEDNFTEPKYVVWIGFTPEKPSIPFFMILPPGSPIIHL